MSDVSYSSPIDQVYADLSSALGDEAANEIIALFGGDGEITITAATSIADLTSDTDIAILDADLNPSSDDDRSEITEGPAVIDADIPVVIVRTDDAVTIEFSGMADRIVHSGGGDDALTTLAGDDMIEGGLGDDAISAGEGRDLIRGLRGADTIDGGAGSDILEVGQSSSDFEIAQTDEGFELTHRATGAVSTVRNVEFMTFTDMVLIAVPNAERADVVQIYQALLNRPADVEGYDFFGGNLELPHVSLRDVAQAILDDPGVLAIYGDLETIPAEDFVSLLYQNLLGRIPVDGEGEYWVDALAEGISRADVVAAFVTSHGVDEVTHAIIVDDDII